MVPTNNNDHIDNNTDITFWNHEGWRGLLRDEIRRVRDDWWGLGVLHGGEMRDYRAKRWGMRDWTSAKGWWMMDERWGIGLVQRDDEWGMRDEGWLWGMIPEVCHSFFFFSYHDLFEDNFFVTLKSVFAVWSTVHVRNLMYRQTAKNKIKMLCPTEYPAWLADCRCQNTKLEKLEGFQ